MNILNAQENRVKWAILAVFQNAQKKLVPSKYYLYAGTNTIGRDSNSCEICIDVEGVSNVHAEIQISEEGDACIVDLNSKQGVFKTASLNPAKKVKVDSTTRSTIYPDSPFYLGKYKCFVVAFDDDYRRGEARRQLEIKLQPKPEQKDANAELTETDLDEEEEEDQQGKGESQQENPVEDVAVEKTLEMNSDEEDNEKNERSLFQGMECEKTLELNSEHEDEPDLFGKPAAVPVANVAVSVSKNKKMEVEYSKGSGDLEATLAVDSEGCSDEPEFDNDRTNQQKTSESKKQKQTEVFEKTLELSSDGENEGDLFGREEEKEEGEKAKQSSKVKGAVAAADDVFEKTLELSDNDKSDDDDMFGEKGDSKKDFRENDGFEKTLALSDQSGGEDEGDMFGNPSQSSQQSKGKQQKEQTKKQSNANCDFEKTLELSDCDGDNDGLEADMFGSAVNEKNSQNNIKNKGAANKSKQIAEKEVAFEKTLAIESDNSGGDSAFDEPKKEQASQPAGKKNMQMECEKLGDNGKSTDEVESQPYSPKPSPVMMTTKKQLVDKNIELEATLIDSPSASSDSAVALPATLISNNSQSIKGSQQSNYSYSNSLNEYSYNNKNKSNNNNNYYNGVRKLSNSQQMNQSLPATLIDSPSMSMSQSMSQSQMKRSRGLSPTLVDDDSSMMKLSQNTNSSNRHKKQSLQSRRSPISLSPTFLDEEVNLNLLSVNAAIKQKGSNNILLSPTLVDCSDSKSVQLSDNGCRSPLPNTLIDDPETCELMEKIRMQEEELSRLRLALQKNNKGNEKQQLSEKTSTGLLEKPAVFLNVVEKVKKGEYVINVLPSSSHEMSPKPIEMKESVKMMYQKQQEVIKVRKNIDLDRVNNFDDLFDGESDDEGNNQVNDSHLMKPSENSNTSALGQSDSSMIAENASNKNVSRNSGGGGGSIASATAAGVNNFSGVFKQKFFMRALNQQDNKKISLLNSLGVNDKTLATIASGQQQLEGNDALKNNQDEDGLSALRKSGGSANPAVSVEQAGNKGKKEKQVGKKQIGEFQQDYDNSEDDSLGEDPKKRLKVNSNWGILKSKNPVSRKSDESSRDSLVESSSKQLQNNDAAGEQKQKRQSNMLMHPEDAEGRPIVEGLKIAVTNEFKLRPEEKRGIKAMKCSFVEEDTEEFDILVVSELKRTIKLLLAILKKKPIVDSAWLKDSIARKAALGNYASYPVKEDASFKEQFKTSLQSLVEKREEFDTDESSVFEGLTFYISKSIEEVRDEELVSLVEAGAGSIRKTLPNKQMKKDQSVYVVLSRDDEAIFKTVSKLKSVTCVTVEFVLSSAQNSELSRDESCKVDASYFGNK